MPRECFFSGVKTTVGNRVLYRGKPKYQGGIGLKVTSISKRKFRPNLQSVTAIIDGRPTRIQASARAIRQGLVVKPLKRRFGYSRTKT